MKAVAVFPASREVKLSDVAKPVITRAGQIKHEALAPGQTKISPQARCRSVPD